MARPAGFEASARSCEAPLAAEGEVGTHGTAAGSRRRRHDAHLPAWRGALRLTTAEADPPPAPQMRMRALSAGGSGSRRSTGSTGFADFANRFLRSLSDLEARGAELTAAAELAQQDLAARLQALSRGMAEIRAVREAYEERTVKEANVLEDSARIDLGIAQQARSDAEAKAVKVVDRQFHELRGALRDERLAREMSLTNALRDLGSEVHRLNGDFEKAQLARAAQGERIVAELDSQLEKLHAIVLSEQRLRVEAERSLVRMQDDVVGQIVQEVQEERRCREVAQSKLLAMLEETCNRVEVVLSTRSEQECYSGY
eukprot:gnl/TRDRNA2_/TRDRNA2_29672_c0_seq1.p1 gnl/TRDRNA2_/TRDRNA2_29672_c0~~gnl/TRDRNA2_/TRDRNA2_29672_c0_seq1.p1  ORF type:complete len:315 (+),score=75.98 gnl/TRDRNA2_/TRDRNA2_29672_c0_seq1:28-972(+)